MGPLDIERLLKLPAACRVVGRQRGSAGLVDDLDRRGWERESGIECIQVTLDIGIVISIDDGDRLAAAGRQGAVDQDIVKPVGGFELAGVYAPEGGPPPPNGCT